MFHTESETFIFLGKGRKHYKIPPINPDTLYNACYFHSVTSDVVSVMQPFLSGESITGKKMNRLRILASHW